MQPLTTEQLNARVNWPGQGVSRVPYRVYTVAEIYAEEQRRIFHGPVWSFVGLELEIADPGDYRTGYMGEMPVVMVHAEDGEINVLINRCGHRGNPVCIDMVGNAGHLTCVYHNWIYDLKSNLTSVAFEKGIRRKGGMPDDCDKSCHGMRRLRTATTLGLVFATFSDEVAPRSAYLGPEMRRNMERVIGRPMRLIGAYGQVIPNN